jgi:hypothetical protein
LIAGINKKKGPPINGGLFRSAVKNPRAGQPFLEPIAFVEDIGGDP